MHSMGESQIVEQALPPAAGFLDGDWRAVFSQLHAGQKPGGKLKACPTNGCVGQFQGVGQVVNLRAEWQSAIGANGVGYQPVRRMPSCPTTKLTHYLARPQLS